MGLLDALTGWFKKEARDVKQAVDGLEDKLDSDLSRRERDLTATPEERMATIAEEQDGDDLLAEVQAKLDEQHGRALAEEELIDPPPTDSDAITADNDPDGEATN